MLRMEKRVTNAMVLGWYEGLEGRSKMIGKKEDGALLEENVARGWSGRDGGGEFGGG